MLKLILFTVLAAALMPFSAMQAKTLCTVLSDATSGKVLHHEGVCDERVTPASTFKIAISLMGYDSGFLIDEHMPVLPFRKGYPAWIADWKNDTDPTSWIKNSVVWYSQQVTQSLGEERFQAYVRTLHYGNVDVSGDPGKHNGLTHAWLSSSLRISPLEEVAFLRGIVRRTFSISAKAYEMTDHITTLPPLSNGWELHGKTGSSAPRNADGSLDWKRAYGWFVGWASRDGRTIVFARLIQNDNRLESIRTGLRARDAMIGELPALLAKY